MTLPPMTCVSLDGEDDRKGVEIFHHVPLGVLNIEEQEKLDRLFGSCLTPQAIEDKPTTSSGR